MPRRRCLAEGVHFLHKVPFARHDDSKIEIWAQRWSQVIECIKVCFQECFNLEPGVKKFCVVFSLHGFTFNKVDLYTLFKVTIDLQEEWIRMGDTAKFIKILLFFTVLPACVVTGFLVLFTETDIGVHKRLRPSVPFLVLRNFSHALPFKGRDTEMATVAENVDKDVEGYLQSGAKLKELYLAKAVTQLFISFSCTAVADRKLHYVTPFFAKAVKDKGGRAAGYMFMRACLLAEGIFEPMTVLVKNIRVALGLQLCQRIFVYLLMDDLHAVTEDICSQLQLSYWLKKILPTDNTDVVRRMVRLCLMGDVADMGFIEISECNKGYIDWKKCECGYTFHLPALLLAGLARN
ncbi:hypothetical protein SELMODRAFT_418109 [Selaginella moellendorffii]|uniref:Uncharacterized protein n=1 Tax=Selaginella moellendorffii TaxID=88036 RepID=D8S4Q0_SELML|nr:hypothetical protein SELMODRAFT_418109 [Selaginella moellendorffii]